MNIVYLDPSAWVKRYIAEPGSEGIDALWEAIRQERVQATCLWLGFTELVWVLQRRRNAGSLIHPHLLPFISNFVKIVSESCG